ncbi:MAG: outer membrane lipoprotein-sorting protein [Acidobacteriota bacterium]|nr:outer membrane lipoprotein-sorting protein [Acidobacteriota bacterium]
MAVPVSQTIANRLNGFFIRLILAFAFLAPAATAAEPPPDLARRVAHRESETQAERNQYAYRQSVRLLELSERGAELGEHRETRDVIFSPTQERSERLIGTPTANLKHLLLTEEDFRDIREIQPFVLVEDLLWIYETKFKGEENMDGVDCWVIQIRPRQILQGQRLFDGMLWIKKDDYSIVRSEGQAVPQIRTMKSENLFPRFTTIRKPVNGGLWFPVYTYADDTLFFRSGPQRIKLTIRYSEYRKFGSDSSITFSEK